MRFCVNDLSFLRGPALRRDVRRSFLRATLSNDGLRGFHGFAFPIRVIRAIRGLLGAFLLVEHRTSNLKRGTAYRLRLWMFDVRRSVFHVLVAASPRESPNGMVPHGLRSRCCDGRQFMQYRLVIPNRLNGSILINEESPGEVLVRASQPGSAAASSWM